MADYDSSLPIRSEADPDERVQVKNVDFNNPDQGQEIDANGNAAVKTDGVYDGSNNVDPSSTALIAHVASATPGVDTQTQRVTATSGEDNAVAIDVALRDSSGAKISTANPLPVYVSANNPGTAVVDFSQGSEVATDASVTHTYTVPAGSTLRLTRVFGSASGKMRFEVKAGDLGSTNTLFVDFNSTSKPGVEFTIDAEALSLTEGQVVEIVKLNRDKAAQDLYSTIVGELV